MDSATKQSSEGKTFDKEACFVTGKKNSILLGPEGRISLQVNKATWHLHCVYRKLCDALQLLHPGLTGWKLSVISWVGYSENSVVGRRQGGRERTTPRRKKMHKVETNKCLQHIALLISGPFERASYSLRETTIIVCKQTFISLICCLPNFSRVGSFGYQCVLCTALPINPHKYAMLVTYRLWKGGKNRGSKASVSFPCLVTQK